MSVQAASGQFVTKEAFSRLENELRTRFDEMMGVVKAQGSRGNIPYDRPTHKDYDHHHYETIDTQTPPESLINQINQRLEQLEARLCDRLTAQITSQFQTEIRDVKESVQKLSQSVNTSTKQAVEEMQKTVEAHGQKMEKNIAKVMLRTMEGHGQKIEKNVEGLEETMERDYQNIEENVINDEIQKMVESHGEKMKDSILNSLHEQSDNTRVHVNKKITESTKLLKANIYKLKREIFAFTEKECQLVRDRVEGRLPSHKTYTLDFYVESFKGLIKSGNGRYSPPWHINQFKSSLQGIVKFPEDGKMAVLIMHGRHPREVGLQPRQCGKLKVKATITDTTGKLPDLQVGERTWETVTEESIKDNRDCGLQLGEMDCQDIVKGGYADISGYLYNAVLVRYVVDVL